MSNNAYIRPVTEKDIDLLYQWANDKTVRANAFSTDTIPYENHQKWFAARMQDANTKMYIYVCDEQPIGQIRIELEGECAVIDYSIAATMRHQGHGKRMLRLLELEVKTNLKNIRFLEAKVKSTNAASQKVFITNGYEEQYVTYRKPMQSTQ